MSNIKILPDGQLDDYAMRSLHYDICEIRWANIDQESEPGRPGLVFAGLRRIDRRVLKQLPPGLEPRGDTRLRCQLAGTLLATR